MSIIHRFHNEIVIIDVGDEDGALVEGEIEKFIDSAAGHVKSEKGIIAFDMSKKKYLNSWGLGQLIKAKDSLTDRGIELYLIKLTPRVSTLLTMVGVDGFFKVVSSENEIN